MRNILRKITFSTLAIVMAFGVLTSSPGKAEAGSYFGNIDATWTVTLNGISYFAFRHVNEAGYPTANYNWVVPASDAATIAMVVRNMGDYYVTTKMRVTVSCNTCNSVMNGTRQYWIAEKVSMGINPF